MKTKNMIQRLCFLLLVLALSTQAQAATKSFTIGKGTLNGYSVTNVSLTARGSSVDGFQFRFTTTGSAVNFTYENTNSEYDVWNLEALGDPLMVKITAPSDVSMSRVTLSGKVIN